MMECRDYKHTIKLAVGERDALGIQGAEYNRSSIHKRGCIWNQFIRILRRDIMLKLGAHVKKHFQIKPEPSTNLEYAARIDALVGDCPQQGFLVFSDQHGTWPLPLSERVMTLEGACIHYCSGEHSVFGTTVRLYLESEAQDILGKLRAVTVPPTLS
jgi:hypothetical protein